jgi:hypothetical protein
VTTLHITNGDCAADMMRTFLRDPVKITCEVLHDGPVPPEPDWIAAAPDEYDEVVLWFEHDLYDQLLLIRALDTIVRLKPDTTNDTPRENVSLICIDRFPGVEPFYGLGQLTAAQLATLADTRRPVTGDQYALASHAWTAFRSSDPRELLQVAQLATTAERARNALPFLGAALMRFFAEYPSKAHGLSRTEELALRALADGPTAAGALFGAAQSHETRPFMGDWSFYDILRRLASARTPLVTVDGAGEGPDMRAATIAATDAGREVIEGTQDAIALNGIDRWLGGVHLIGDDHSPWRWDSWRETLVS